MNNQTEANQESGEMIVTVLSEAEIVKAQFLEKAREVFELLSIEYHTDGSEIDDGVKNLGFRTLELASEHLVDELVIIEWFILTYESSEPEKEKLSIEEYVANHKAKNIVA